MFYLWFEPMKTKGEKMRKPLCSLIIAGLLLIPTVVVAGRIPADHPIFQEKNWVFERSSEDFSAVDNDGTSVVYNKFLLYRHPAHDEYSMQEGLVLGEVVTRLYYLMDPDAGGHTKAFRLLGEDGIWRGGHKLLWPEILRDSSGKIIGARLTMVDEKGDTLFIRDVMRK